MPYREGDDARRVHLQLVERLTVETPCRESWNAMSGDERVRHCSTCAKDVHDLSAMSLEEIATLVQRLEGNLCARFYRRPDGRLVTGYCPSTDRPRRAARIAGATTVAAGIATATALVAVPPRAASTEIPSDEPALSPDDPPPPDPEDENEDEDEGIHAIQGELVVTMGVVSSSPIEPRVLVALPQASTAPARFYEPPCSRVNPAGEFSDEEIRLEVLSPDIGAPPGSSGWAGPRSSTWIARPCPIARRDDDDGEIDDEIETAID